MNRVLLTGLLLLALLALGCNKAADKKTAAGEAQAGDQAAPVMASGGGTQGLEVTQAPDPREAKEEYVQLVKQIAPEYGIRYDSEKDLLYTPEGVALGTPAELASRVDSLMDPAAEPAMGEPMEAIRYMLEGLVNPAQPEEPPQEIAPQVEEPVAEKPDMSNLNIEEMVVALAPEYSLTYDRDNRTLNGEGFRAGGVDIGIVASKVDFNLKQRGENSAQAREAEVRTVLSQLVDAGKQAAAQRQEPGGSTTAEADTGAAQSGRGRKPLEYHPDDSEFIHPREVYGDWKSIREDHPNNDEVAHDDNWYYDVQLRYRGNSVFRLHTNGQIASNNEFPYRYDPRNGVLSLLDAQGETVQTYTVWATEQDPLLIWLQREGSRIKTLYQKVGLGGEPVTEEELIAGIRELLGEEGVQNYLKYKEQQRREQSEK